jgi:hypothetical protein
MGEEGAIYFSDTAGIEFSFNEQAEEQVSINHSNYSNGLFENLLAGRIRPGFVVVERDSDMNDHWTSKDYLKTKQNGYIDDEDLASLDYAPHVVCLLVNMGSCLDQRTIKAVKEIVTKIKAIMGASILIVFTQADLYLRQIMSDEISNTNILHLSTEQVL